MERTNYSQYNAEAVLKAVNNCIAELEAQAVVGAKRDYDRVSHRGYDYTKGFQFKISTVYKELSIFDWWNENLSMSQLKQMKKFLEQAIKLGFTGYVCFKVGASGCSHGMWAHKEESTDGYSPDGDVLYHSFRSGDNYFDLKLNGKWMREMEVPEWNGRWQFTLAEIKKTLV